MIGFSDQFEGLYRFALDFFTSLNNTSSINIVSTNKLITIPHSVYAL